MAQTNTVLTDAYIEINSVNHSDGADNVSLPMTIEQLDATCFGSTTRVHEPGLKGFSCTVNFKNDFTDNLRDELLYNIWNGRSKVAIEIRPTSASKGAGNPGYQFTAFISAWNPVNGTVGQLAGGSITLTNTTAITRAVA